MELSGIHLWGAGKRRNANKEVERREETGERREGREERGGEGKGFLGLWWVSCPILGLVSEISLLCKSIQCPLHPTKPLIPSFLNQVVSYS